MDATLFRYRITTLATLAAAIAAFAVGSAQAAA
jgi:hypothetical protein